MNYLVDVNVALAMALTGHVHHRIARERLDEPETELILLCRVTQHGLLRLLTNHRIMGGNALTGREAWKVHDSFYEDRRVRFATEPPGIDEPWRRETAGQMTGPNFWTDAYLAAFAEAAGYT